MAAETARAVAGLLRLAAAAGRDAQVLASADGLSNAARLAAQAAAWAVQAVAVSEQGWPLEGGLNDIPPENPLRPDLVALSRACPPPSAAIRPNGLPAAEPDGEQLRRGLDRLGGVLADLGERFGVALAGDSPARTPAPIRPAPKPEPPPPPPRKPAPPPPARIVVGGKPTPRPPPPTEPVPPSAPISPHARSGPVASTPFWSLMDQWGVSDSDALALLGHPGGLTKKGTRPRFRLEGAEAERFAALREIDAALRALGLEPRAWLARPAAEPPFRGAPPLAFLINQGSARDVSRFVLQQGLRLSMA